MNFTEILLMASFVFGGNFQHDDFCQNLYFQPNALEQMEYFHCDIQKTSQIIQEIKRG